MVDNIIIIHLGDERDLFCFVFFCFFFEISVSLKHKCFEHLKKKRKKHELTLSLSLSLSLCFYVQRFVFLYVLFAQKACLLHHRLSRSLICAYCISLFPLYDEMTKEDNEKRFKPSRYSDGCIID